MKKAAVIHTTPVTIPVIRELAEKKFRERGISAEVVNFLDDSMLPEINRCGEMTAGVRFRLHALVTLAASTGADAILCACSSIGDAFEEEAALTKIPLLRIDAPMAARAAGYQRVGVAATLASTLTPTCGLIQRMAQKAGNQTEISVCVAKEAGDLLAQSREAEYDETVAAALRELLRENQVAVLAQASMARVLPHLTKEERKRCLTSVDSGVEALAKLLER